MTHHNVLPELGSLFPRFALIFNNLIKRTTCARVKAYEFLCWYYRVSLFVWYPLGTIHLLAMLFSSQNCQWLKKNYCQRKVCANTLCAYRPDSSMTQENHQPASTILLPYSSRTSQVYAHIIHDFCSHRTSKLSKSVKIVGDTSNSTRTHASSQKCTMYWWVNC